MNELLEKEVNRLQEANTVLPYICLSIRYPNSHLKTVSSNLCNLAFLKKGFKEAKAQDVSSLMSGGSQHMLSGNVLLSYRMLEALFEWGCLKCAEDALPPPQRKECRLERRSSQEKWVNSLAFPEIIMLEFLLNENHIHDRSIPIDRIEFMRILRNKFTETTGFFDINSSGDDYANPVAYEMMLLTKYRKQNNSSERSVNVNDATETIVGLLRIGAYEMARCKAVFDGKRCYSDLTDSDIDKIVAWTFDLIYKDTSRPFSAMDTKGRLTRSMKWEVEQIKTVLRNELFRLRKGLGTKEWLADVQECEEAGMTVRQEYNKKTTKDDTVGEAAATPSNVC